jgi:Bacterial SH3 domain
MDMWVAWICALGIASSMVAFTTALALAASPPAGYHYLVGLDPAGDNWLALRSEPSLKRGFRVMKMGPETLLTVLERKGDWVRVQTATGETGWAVSKYIACCRTLSNEASGHRYSPAPGSAEEAAILSAVRPSIEAELRTPVVLTAKKIRIVGNFAHADVVPRRPDGKIIQIQRPDWMDAYADAILEKRQNRWSVLQSAVGPADVWYCTFVGRVPKQLLDDC